MSALLIVALQLSASIDAAERCATAHFEVQRARRDGRLAAASQWAQVCARDECVSVLRAECANWQRELDIETPSLLLAVVDRGGVDVPGWQVGVNGRAVHRVPGIPFPVDPGFHTLKVAAPGYVARTLRVEARVGERARRLTVVLDAIPRAARPTPRPVQVVPVVPVVAGALALVGLGSWVGFGIAARAGEDSLLRCSPGCTQDAVSGVKRDYALANAGWVSALVGAGLLGVWWWWQPSSAVAPVLSEPSPR